jgi:hypothetical protein
LLTYALSFPSDFAVCFLLRAIAWRSRLIDPVRAFLFHSAGGIAV